jgi:hypothetical protein
VEVIDEQGDLLGPAAFPLTHPAIVRALMGEAPHSLAHPSVVMRKEPVLSAGGYDQQTVPSEDMDLWIRLSRIGELANLPEPLLRYRRHAGATGFQQRARQLVTQKRLADAARESRGLPASETPVPREILSPTGNYHFQCADVAMRSGSRAAALKHLRATIACAPLWWKAYAALALNALPAATSASVLKLYGRVRSARRRSTR